MTHFEFVNHSDEAAQEIERVKDITSDLDGHIKQAIEEGQSEDQAFHQIECMISEIEGRHGVSLDEDKAALSHARAENEAALHEIDRRGMDLFEMLTMPHDSVEYEEDE